MYNYFALPGLKFHPIINRAVIPEKIMIVVAEYFDLSIIKMVSRDRHREIVLARAVCFKMMREKTKLSLKGMGKYLGDRDHTSVMHALASIRDQVSVDPDIRRIVAEIETLL